METLDLKIVAATAGLVEGFEPASWVPLPGPRGRCVLVSDGERSVIAALLTGPAIAEAESENLGAAVLRSLLPQSPVSFPHVIASSAVPAEPFDLDSAGQVRVTQLLPGAPVSGAAFAASERLVESLALFMAELHGADPEVLADSGLPVRDVDGLRESLLADLDRGAATGRVPAVLLQRWESALENVAMWRFLPCPVHGALSEDAIRTDGESISAISELGQLHVGDPAVDLAAISVLLDPAVFEQLFSEYQGRRAAADPGLRTRTEVLAELSALDWLLEAHRSGDEAELADAAALLESLAELAGEDVSPHRGGPYQSATAEDSAAQSEDSAKEQDADDLGTDPSGADIGTVRALAGPDTARDADRSDFRPAAPLIDEEAAAAVPTERIERRRFLPDADSADAPDEHDPGAVSTAGEDRAATHRDSE
ncbi:hypothetical protein GCM10022261_16000 [Brevibacterium daeguense]|uniref:Aminoglycoside phosphotransferase domain-containing protein n=1 Tax=Brevibacterium daeguense TaxID=909936 RepID=A0ABP8EJF0_9MICO|nr:aminoglycoside phosphotransferase [Brevibacterium daeguense]